MEPYSETERAVLPATISESNSSTSRLVQIPPIPECIYRIGKKTIEELQLAQEQLELVIEFYRRIDDNAEWDRVAPEYLEAFQWAFWLTQFKMGLAEGLALGRETFEKLEADVKEPLITDKKTMAAKMADVEELKATWNEKLQRLERKFAISNEDESNQSVKTHLPECGVALPDTSEHKAALRDSMWEAYRIGKFLSEQKVAVCEETIEAIRYKQKVFLCLSTMVLVTSAYFLWQCNPCT